MFNIKSQTAGLTLARSFILTVLICLTSVGPVEAQTREFQLTMGFGSSDVGEYARQTAEGGYIMVGTTDISADKTIWLMKFGINGNLQWGRQFGAGVQNESARCVQEADDNLDGEPDGYIVTGFIEGTDGKNDVYLLRTDLKGAPLWGKVFGGGGDDYGNYVAQRSNGGYIVAGRTTSYGLPYSSGNTTLGNLFILTTDKDGNFDWATVISSTAVEIDESFAVREITGGSFVLTGKIGSYGSGREDVVVSVLNSSGNLQWTRVYGGGSADLGHDIQEVTAPFGNDGFILCGSTRSFGSGGYDVYVLRLNSNGTVRWNTVLGGAADDYGYSVTQTQNGDFVVAGNTRSFGAGLGDVYAVSVDANGVYQWSYTYGGGGEDIGRSIQQTQDGGFVIGAVTQSFGAGSDDFYLIKTDGVGRSGCHETSEPGTKIKFGVTEAPVSPCWSIARLNCIEDFTGNAVLTSDVNTLCFSMTCPGGPMFQRNYGGVEADAFHSVEQTNDDGYILSGYTDSYSLNNNRDVFTTKTDPAGTVVWQKHYWPGAVEDISTDYAESVVQTSDGGYFITANTDYRGPNNGYVIKTDASGLTPNSVILTTTPANEMWRGQECRDQSGQPDGYICVGHGGTPAQTLIVRLNANLSTRWANWYSLTSHSLNGFYIQQTDDDGDGSQDDGFVICGVSGVSGETSFMFKIDAAGAVQWGNNYSVVSTLSLANRAWCVQQMFGLGCIKSGYIMAGKAGNDYLMICTDELGIVQWSNVLFRTASDEALSVRQSTDLGFIVTGQSGGKIWSVKTDLTGLVEAGRYYGGLNTDDGFEVSLTSDGGFAFAGLKQRAAFNDQGYLVKTDCNLISGCYENPALPVEIANTASANSLTVNVAPVLIDDPVATQVADAPGDELVCSSLPAQLTTANAESGNLVDGAENDHLPVRRTTDVDLSASVGESLEVFPNPVQRGSMLNIRSAPADDNLTLSVSNALGQLIYSAAFDSPGSAKLHQVNTVGWPAGTYTIVLKSAKGESAGRLVIVLE